jgi:hypothetical protein
MRMGFWKDLWNDDKPCLAFFHVKYTEEPHELEEENRKLKLVIKKMLEQGITEKAIEGGHKLIE